MALRIGAVRLYFALHAEAPPAELDRNTEQRLPFAVFPRQAIDTDAARWVADR